jgi:hypothetical protein
MDNQTREGIEVLSGHQLFAEGGKKRADPAAR